MRRVVVLVAVMGLPLAFVSAREDKGKMVPNKAYENWASFKIGATVVRKDVVTEHEGDNPAVIDVTARPHKATVILNKYTLVEVTPEMAVVSWVQTDVHHHHLLEHSAKRIIYPAMAETAGRGGVLTDKDVPGIKKGEDTLTVAGQEIKCKWAASDIKIGDETSSSKMWWSPDVPGGIVKQETVKKQGDKVIYETKDELVEIKAEKKGG